MAQLNARIDNYHGPTVRHTHFAKAELRHLRDERLGILCGSAEPTEEQVDLVHAQLFGEPAQKELL